MSNVEKDKIKKLSKNLFPVVGIGASAGGLEAFKKLVRAIPENSGIAYVLVQHLYPGHSSLLPEILQREANIPVHEVSDTVEVKPDQVYIIPANKMLVANDDILELSPRPSKEKKIMPIDIFFSSLAEVHQSHAIGVVLSGNGADGTIGLQKIKGRGGITFAQDPGSAANDAMPQSAINANVVDFILPPEKIPQQLLQLSHAFNTLSQNDHAIHGASYHEESFKRIFDLVGNRNGIDISYSKQTIIRKCVLRRMVILGLENIVDYIKYLEQTNAEQDILQDMPGKEASGEKDYSLHSEERRKDDIQKNADDILLSKYVPPGVIVNDQLDIIQFRGATGEFLEPSPGKASLNLLKMAREDLSFELRNALHKSKSSNEPFSKEGILINKGKRLITIDVVPLTNCIEPHFLILFRDPVPVIINKNGAGKNALKSTGFKNSDDKIRIHELETSVLQGREEMRSITEYQDAVNARLQIANEELLSSSKDLQSLNKELEAGKKVLESTNKELTAVNQELFDHAEQHNEARMYAEAIVTTILEPLVILDHDTRIRSANESFYKTFYLTPGEAVGNILFELQDNGWNIPGLHEQLIKIQTGGEKFLEWEITHTFPLAGKRIICIKGRPFQKENGLNRVLLAFDDITVRKEKEHAEKKNAEELIKLLENIPQITLTTSAEGAITYFNKFFLDYSGMSFDEAIKKGWEPMIKPDMLEEFKKSWSHVLTTGEDFSMELQLKKKNENAYRWHLYRASPIRNDEGVISSWVGTATDLHDQKTREHVKDEFMSIASHELKTPLTTAKAYVQLLQLGMEETNHKDLIYVKKAGASIDRLNDLISELLDVSKIQNGKLAMHLSTFNFNEMMTEAIEGVQYASPTHTIIRTGTIKEFVTGDKERLQQVVVNLLSNAIKYSPKANKVLVNMVLKKGEIKVSVKDRGIGIRRENLWKIFERYYREEERTVHFQGLGIGLYISYEIIQRHQGKLWAEINGGRGSTFYFTLPV